MSLNELGYRAINRGGYREAVNIIKQALESGKEAYAFFPTEGRALPSQWDLPTARWVCYHALVINTRHKATGNHKLTTMIRNQKSVKFITTATSAVAAQKK